MRITDARRTAQMVHLLSLDRAIYLDRDRASAGNLYRSLALLDDATVDEVMAMRGEEGFLGRFSPITLAPGDSISFTMTVRFS